MVFRIVQNVQVRHKFEPYAVEQGNKTLCRQSDSKPVLNQKQHCFLS